MQRSKTKAVEERGWPSDVSDFVARPQTQLDQIGEEKPGLDSPLRKKSTVI